MPLREEFVEWSEARANEIQRQVYLNGVLDRFAEIGIPEWAYIDRLIYDPGLEEFATKYGRDESLYSSGNKNWIGLLITKKTPVGVLTAVNNIVFERLDEGGFLSCVDHESTHAYTLKTDRLTIPVQLYQDIPKVLGDIALELAGFSKQFQTIKSGKRRVGGKFYQRTRDEARRCYKMLEKYETGMYPEQTAVEGIRKALETEGTLTHFT